MLCGARACTHSEFYRKVTGLLRPESSTITGMRCVSHQALMGYDDRISKSLSCGSSLSRDIPELCHHHCCRDELGVSRQGGRALTSCLLSGSSGALGRPEVARSDKAALWPHVPASGRQPAHSGRAGQRASCCPQRRDQTVLTAVAWRATPQ